MKSLITPTVFFLAKTNPVIQNNAAPTIRDRFAASSTILVNMKGCNQQAVIKNIKSIINNTVPEAFELPGKNAYAVQTIKTKLEDSATRQINGFFRIQVPANQDESEPAHNERSSRSKETL